MYLDCAGNAGYKLSIPLVRKWYPLNELLN